MQSVCGIRGMVYVNNPKVALSDLVDAGFKSLILDFSVCCEAKELETLKVDQVLERGKHLRKKLHLLLTQAKEKQISFPIAIAPYLLRKTKRTGLNDSLKELAMESLNICGDIGCHYLVVKPLFSGIEKEDLWSVNRDFYLSLAKVAEENQVTILLENQCRNIQGHLVRGICADPVEAAKWIDELNKETEAIGITSSYSIEQENGSICTEQRFGFCMDVGVCNLCGQNMYDFCTELGMRIRAVILRDCDGTKENSLLPFTCSEQGSYQTDWMSLIYGLREIRCGAILALEMEDTAKAFVQSLRSQILMLARATLDYIKNQIDMEETLKKYSSHVLFGAGNRCGKYMQYYGKDYPPLFTCDNNPVMWGTFISGLEVKNPECLKEISEDAVIIVCNMFYREIKEQIREMGLKNPVETFQ